MGYVTAMSPCGQCGRIICYNPNYVPSLNNVPFCKDCITLANPIRVKNGLPLITIHPNAYEPLPEDELR
jgi:hypothetical protein